MEFLSKREKEDFSWSIVDQETGCVRALAFHPWLCIMEARFGEIKHRHPVCQTTLPGGVWNIPRSKQFKSSLTVGDAYIYREYSQIRVESVMFYLVYPDILRGFSRVEWGDCSWTWLRARL